jgi:hypothetical protein
MMDPVRTFHYHHARETQYEESGGTMKRARKSVNIAVALLALVTVATVELAAQSSEMFDKTFALIGNWDTDIGNPDGQDRGNCGGRLGDAGEKLLNCSLPADQLPLNKRGEAWLKYMDHRQSPSLAECAQVAIPSLLSGGGYISAFPDRLVIQHFGSAGSPLITRTVWMSGNAPRPIPGELFQHGHSVGHFDGDDLVIETTNFMFDPDGLDDHLHMASSVRKKVTERYRLIDNETLRLIITVEDPTFLAKPFTYAFLMVKRPGGPPPSYRACDPEVARNEVYFAYPGDKYGEDDELAERQ